MVREGFKETVFGEIPESWSISEIGAHTKWLSGGTPNRHVKEFWNGSIPWISGSTLKQVKIYTSDQFLTEEAIRLGSKMAPLESTLLLVRGSALHKEIRAGRVTANVSFNQDVKCLIPDDQLVPEYLTYYILGFANRILKLVSSAGNSAGVLDTKLVKGFPLLLPSRLEQAKVCEALSDVDEWITCLENLMQKKNDVRTATMQQLLTGKKRLPGFGEGKHLKQTELGEIPEDWSVLPLGELLKIRHGKSQKDVIDPDGKYPILATGGEIGRAIVPLYNKPSVLIGRKGTIDRPYYMATPFWSVDTLFYSEIAESVDAKFLFYKFLFIDWRQFNEASGVPSLSSKTIENIKQAIPLNKEEQKAISNVLSGFDREIDGLKAQLRKARQIKEGMMQELLTGRTRLVDAEVGEPEE
tara:strand:- start:5069 stop:6304 length:1236 start_codon:yes stop_codon:yes gene_type:complete